MLEPSPPGPGVALTAAITRVDFAPSGPLQAELRAAVEEDLARTGRPVRGGWRMGLKVAAIIGWLAASYLALLLLPVPGWAAALLALSVGLAIAGVGFNVMHDANHGTLSSRPAVNRAFAYAADLIGGSSWLWRHKHNVLHHTWPNVAGMDTDGDAGLLLRLTPQQPHRRYHRFQHLYAWALYGVFALKWWLYDDLRELLAGRIGGHAFARPRGGALAGLLLGKALFLGWAFVLPLLLHPTLWLLPLWLLASAAAGLTLASVFQLAHCVGEVDHPQGREGEALPLAWAELQLATTSDFARGRRLLSWYVGGLNYQVEHHLFPGICHLRYPELAPIVERVCLARGVPYRAQPSLRAALSANLRWLRQLGAGVPAPGAAAGP